MQQQQGDINPELLSCSKAVKYEVHNRPIHYRQSISYQDGALRLMVVDVTVDDLPRRDFDKSVSFSIPVTLWLRRQFNIIEQFVKDNVDLASLPSCSSNKDFVYKPLWHGHSMYVSVSPACTFHRFNSPPGELQPVDMSLIHGRGKYSFTIALPYIYIGPHKKGEDYSLSLELVQVIFTPIETVIRPEVSIKRPRKPKKHVPVAQMEVEVKV